MAPIFFDLTAKIYDPLCQTGSSSDRERIPRWKSAAALNSFATVELLLPFAVVVHGGRGGVVHADPAARVKLSAEVALVAGGRHALPRRCRRSHRLLPEISVKVPSIMTEERGEIESCH